jgi:cell division protein ZapA (FtsZ GTPase activity inhibitor)
MASKQDKLAKRLKKQVKQLTKRLDELNDSMAVLVSALNAQHEQDALNERFTEEDVESANDMTDEAEEAADILEKRKRK